MARQIKAAIGIKLLLFSVLQCDDLGSALGAILIRMLELGHQLTMLCLSPVPHQEHQVLNAHAYGYLSADRSFPREIDTFV